MSNLTHPILSVPKLADSHATTQCLANAWTVIQLPMGTRIVSADSAEFLVAREAGGADAANAPANAPGGVGGWMRPIFAVAAATTHLHVYATTATTLRLSYYTGP